MQGPLQLIKQQFHPVVTPPPFRRRRVLPASMGRCLEFLRNRKPNLAAGPAACIDQRLPARCTDPARQKCWRWWKSAARSSHQPEQRRLDAMNVERPTFDRTNISVATQSPLESAKRCSTLPANASRLKRAMQMATVNRMSHPNYSMAKVPPAPSVPAGLSWQRFSQSPQHSLHRIPIRTTSPWDTQSLPRLLIAQQPHQYFL